MVQLTAACGTTKPVEEPGLRDDDQAELRKDEAFRRQVDQPIPLAGQRLFHAEAFRSTRPMPSASFTPAAARTPLQMPTSAGKMRDMSRHARCRSRSRAR
jgi:hypothetical protein